jgi:hypothetical protein
VFVGIWEIEQDVGGLARVFQEAGVVILQAMVEG